MCGNFQLDCVEPGGEVSSWYCPNGHWLVTNTITEKNICNFGHQIILTCPDCGMQEIIDIKDMEDEK